MIIASPSGLPIKRKVKSKYGTILRSACAVRVLKKRKLLSENMRLGRVPMITRKFGILSVSEVCPAPMLQ